MKNLNKIEIYIFLEWISARANEYMSQVRGGVRFYNVFVGVALFERICNHLNRGMGHIQGYQIPEDKLYTIIHYGCEIIMNPSLQPREFLATLFPREHVDINLNYYFNQYLEERLQLEIKEIETLTKIIMDKTVELKKLQEEYNAKQIELDALWDLIESTEADVKEQTKILETKKEELR